MYVYIYVYIYPYLTKAQANEAYKRRCEKRAQRLQLHQHHCQHQLRPFNCRSYNCSKWALTNIRSLCNKQNDFALFLAVESPDVVCVTETWLHADIPDSLLCCKGYNVIRCDRNGRGGGVAMFVRNNIKFSPVDISSEFSMLELTCVDLQCNAYCSHTESLVTIEVLVVPLMILIT